jgi:hypothetical protein
MVCIWFQYNFQNKQRFFAIKALDNINLWYTDTLPFVWGRNWTYIIYIKYMLQSVNKLLFSPERRLFHILKCLM